MNKTLVGKDDCLFLHNDSARELEVHCNNLNLVSDPKLYKYSFPNYFLTIYPDKSLIYKDYLPDGFCFKYRPAFDIYKNVLKNRLFDGYDILKNEENTYYKTDTHINLKGNYLIYNGFIDRINQLYNLGLPKKEIHLLSKNVELSSLCLGIGDLTWETNLGNQTLNDKIDTYYYANEIVFSYPTYKIVNDSPIRFLTYDFQDKTALLEKNNELF